MSRLPRNLVLSLIAVEAASWATMARSVLLARWTTVVATIVLVWGVRAAMRERTWGIGVVLATSAAFPVAATMGFAPPWFWLVGILGVVPFLLTVKPMVRFDRGATVLFTALAGGTSIAAAYAWREAALALFYAVHTHHVCH